MRGSSLACAACWGSRRGRRRRCRGPPGSRPQPLARPPRSPSLLWRPPTRRPWPVRGLPPAFAACWGSRRGRPRRCRGPPGSRPQPLARPPRSLSLLWRPPTRRPWPVRGPPPLSRRAGDRGLVGRGGVAARQGRGCSPSRAVLALLRCCGGHRRGARGPCGVRPPLSRRAGGRGVVGRGGGAACRGRGRNPSRALLALFCGCGSPRRCVRFLRWGCHPCWRRAGGRGRGRGVARWGCGPSFLRVRGPFPGRGGGAGCLGGGGGHLGWLRPLGPAAAARPAPPPPPASAPRAPRGSFPSTPGGRGSGSGTGGGGGRPAGGSHRSLPSLLPW